MSRHQPEHGADSAEALAAEESIEVNGHKYVHVAACWCQPPSVIDRRCLVCDLPAQPLDIYCLGHARLLEYHATDETHWAANE